MSIDDADDEDWYDDDDEPDDHEADACPECGAAVPSITDKCPECGYWLSAGDRRTGRRPLWLRVTAWIVLAAFVLGLLAFAWPGF